MTTTDTRRVFSSWTGDRRVPSLGTNDGATPLPFQGWHHFKEAFAPELIAKAVDASPIEVRSCIDPFGGSGTTALACQMMGIESATVEVNPFLADVIRAKLARYDIDEIATLLAEVRHRARTNPADPTKYFRHLPQTFIQPGSKERWLFSLPVAGRIASILQAIDSVAQGDCARLFRVVLGGMLCEVSNVVVSGKGRRYRKNWRATEIEAVTVDVLFAERCSTAILDCQAFAHRPRVKAMVIEGDARTATVPGIHDLAVFSPPYPNSFDYTDVYNLQLWMLGYLCHSEDNRSLRTSTLTSHVQLIRNYPIAPSGSETLDAALKNLNEVRSGLWSPWIPQMVGGYFTDLTKVIGMTFDRLSEGAQSWLVVGDSRYAECTIPVSKILVELAAARGWSVVDERPIRHMKSSAQQGWKPELAESLLILERRV
jgi:hypothetical protein